VVKFALSREAAERARSDSVRFGSGRPSSARWFVRLNEGARARSERASEASVCVRVRAGVRRARCYCVALRCVTSRCFTVRRGAVCCGAVRCGAVRCGAVRCDVVRRGAVPRDDGEGYYEWKTRPWLGC